MMIINNNKDFNFFARAKWQVLNSICFHMFIILQERLVSMLGRWLCPECKDIFCPMLWWLELRLWKILDPGQMYLQRHVCIWTISLCYVTEPLQCDPCCLCCRSYTCKWMDYHWTNTSLFNSPQTYNKTSVFLVLLLCFWSLQWKIIYVPMSQLNTYIWEVYHHHSIYKWWG